MTQNAPDAPTFTQAEVSMAQSAEDLALKNAQNEYLTRRVVVLRAQLNKANATIQELQSAIASLTEDESGKEEPTPEETPESDPENSPEG